MRWLTKLKMKLDKTPLHTAIEDNDPKTCDDILADLAQKPLVVRQEFLNKLNKRGDTALQLANIFSYTIGRNYLFMLLELGANPYLEKENPLDTFISSKRLDWVKLLLWYNQDYKQVICRFRTAEKAIDTWSDSHSCNHPQAPTILSQINKTLRDIKTCQQAIATADDHHAKLTNTAVLSSSQRQEHSLLAATHYQQAAQIFEAYAKETAANEYEKENMPKDYNALVHHYQAKALKCYQQATNCYTHVPIENMNANQHKTFLQAYQQLLVLTQILNPIAVTQQYIFQFADYTWRLATYYKNSPEQALQYQQQAIRLYEDALALAEQINHPENTLTSKHQAAQFFQQLTLTASEENKALYLQRTKILYLQLAKLCKTLHKYEQANVYTQLASQIDLSSNELNPSNQEEIHKPFELFNSYHQRSSLRERLHKNAPAPGTIPLLALKNHDSQQICHNKFA